MNIYKTQPPETVLVVGATSSLAQIICREFARKGFGLTLAGRDENELETLASDLAVRYGIACRMLVADVNEAHFSATQFIEDAGTFTHSLLVLGDMGNDDRDDAENIAHITATNYTAPALIASAIAQVMAEKKQKGIIAVISSVAGDRGRQSNYPYGSAKAALSTFTSGLRNRYYKQGIHVMTVKPGFIDTPMTWGLHSPLIVSREYVASMIVKAFERKIDILYTPWFWRWIMLLIGHIPEKIFKRFSL